MPSTGGSGRGGGDDAGSASSESGRSASKGASSSSSRGGGGGGGSYRGYTPAQISHLSSIGLGNSVFGTDANDAALWAANQQRQAQRPNTFSEDEWGLGYVGMGPAFDALNETIAGIDKSGLSTLDKSIATAMAKRGNLKGLQEYGVDTAGMQKAYGGVKDTIGSMFGGEVNDVQTPHEAAAGLMDRGMAKVNEEGFLKATPQGAAAAVSTPLGFFGKIGGAALGSLFGPLGTMAGGYLGGLAAPDNPYDFGTAEKLSGLASGLMGPVGGAVNMGVGVAGDLNLASEMQKAGVTPTQQKPTVAENKSSDGWRQWIANQSLYG